MRDARVHAVGPVVAQDPVVRAVGKRRRVAVGECRLGGGAVDVVVVPAQSLLADVVGDAPVLGFDAGRPGNVAAEVGGFADERAEVVAGCWGG